MKHGVMLLSASALLCTVPRAWAYRPFDGTDAAVADTGEFELELGPAATVRRKSFDFALPAAVLNLGFAPGWEAVFDIKNILTVARALPHRVTDQAADTDLLVKAVLRRGCLQGGTGPSLATELGVLLPNANGEIGVG